jgi:hypothetical protein
MTFQFNMMLDYFNVNLIGSGCAIFDHGCRQGMCTWCDGAYHHPSKFIFITSSVIYTSRTGTAYLLHQRELPPYSDH